MTEKELAIQLSEESKLSYDTALQCVYAFFDRVAEGLIEKRKGYIPGVCTITPNWVQVHLRGKFLKYGVIE